MIVMVAWFVLLFRFLVTVHGAEQLRFSTKKQ